MRKGISTLFLSLQDFSNSGLPMSTRAWSQPFSHTSRGILRQGTFWQRFGFKGKDYNRAGSPDSR